MLRATHEVVKKTKTTTKSTVMLSKSSSLRPCSLWAVASARTILARELSTLASVSRALRAVCW